MYLRKKSKMERVFLLLGSNQGKREEFLAKAISKLEQKFGSVITRSSYYETAPWGDANQADFINQVIEIEVSCTPIQLLEIILGIEIELGRLRNPNARYGARNIDIDILYFGDEILDTPSLTIPHPRIQERRFALEPLVEIGADFIHPITKLSQLQMLEQCVDPLAVKKLRDNHI